MEIDKLAEKDHFTKDSQYNSGLRLIKENGYINVCGHPDVKYYCMCNIRVKIEKLIEDFENSIANQNMSDLE